jgi:hypothetical protein
MAGTGDTVPLDRHTYEDPFLDMAATKLPKSFKKLLELCQIFAMTHPQISPIIQRLAEYPITSLVYKGDDEAERQHKDLFEKHLRILEKMVEWGLDYYAYGNCFVSISFPFVRLYRCLTCENDVQARELQYRYLGGRFEGMCKTCKRETQFKPIDQYVKDKSDINIFRLEPQLVTPKYNRVTGKYLYYYDIPPDIKRSVSTGDRDVIDGTPVEYLNCIRLKRKMKLDRVFHFKRPTLSGRDMQWGFPLVLPALKDAYLNQIYKKADEQIALEHSVPLRVLYPEPRTQDPMQKLALGNFKSFMARNIRYWRQDKNAIITSPMPIGITNIGGDANAYSTIQARIKVIDEIMGAMMVTRGFVMGGENWSSASISQRVMENSFMNYLRRMDACLQWVRDEIAAFLEMPPCAVSMKPFKKVDDVQMLQLILQLAREKKVSWEEALSRMDLDSKEELKIIETETVGYTNVMLQELLAQNEANAKAIVSQTIAQQEAEGLQQIDQNRTSRSEAILAEVKGTATKDEMAESQQEQSAAAAEQDPNTQAVQARASRDSAQAEKDTALAQKYQGGGGEEEQQQQPQQQAMVDVDLGKQIALWAGELLSAKPAEQKQLLQALHNDNPEIASAVVEVAKELEGGMRQPAEGEAMSRSQSPQAMLKALLTDAKSPEELAQKMQMIEPRQQNQVLMALSKTNPRLFNQVMSAIQKLNAGDTGGRGDSVDMRPMPEQKPPTRTEKSV